MKRILLSILALLIISHFVAATEQKEAHHHHDVGQKAITLNSGEKWPIDESLHIGMSSIKDKIIRNLDDIHYNRLSDKQYSLLALALDKQLAYLFENCKLPPQADAQLHTLLAQIAQGVGKIKQENNKKQGAILIINALKEYPKYFNDPDWLALAH